MDLPDKVRAAIRKYAMLKPADRALVGLSGGADSVCLTHVLHTLGYPLHAVYVDHGLRPQDAPGEIEFCRGFCESLGIGFGSVAVDVKGLKATRGMGTQEAARELRLAMLDAERVSTGSDRIALGHTMDDQAETVLMRLIRGAGRRGLGGIAPVRVPIIRPLIETTREEIEGYLASRNVGYITDPTNLEDAYHRNRIRHTLVPVLKGFNPGILQTLSNEAHILRDEDLYLRSETHKAMMRLITNKAPLKIELFLAPLRTLHKVILRRVLRHAVEVTEGLGSPGFAHIEDIIGLIHDGDSGDRLHLPGGVRVIIRYSTLLITAEPPVILKTRTLEPGVPLAMAEAGLVMEAYAAKETPTEAGTGIRRAIFDAAKVGLPLTVRARQDGDFFYPEGMGGRKKIKDYFIDEKVPRDERGAVPLVVTPGGDIIWVAGMRADERFRADEGTKEHLVLVLKQSFVRR